MRSSGIFSRISRDSSAERKNDQQDFSDDIALNLNGNKLTFVENQWIAQSDDLDRAAAEIELIIEERDELLLTLEESSLHNEALIKEIIETNDMKNVALGMVRTPLICFTLSPLGSKERLSKDIQSSSTSSFS